ncbi:MAG: hypothetical protein RR942_18055 [Romboutsia sp.]
MFVIIDYKTTKNKYKTQGETTLVTILNKKSAELTIKIDTRDLDKVQEAGIWFAEWNKDFNTYFAQSQKLTKTDKRIISTKRNLQSLILDTKNDAPIKHINGNVLDNRRCNVEVLTLGTKNDYEVVDNDTIAVILKDKYGRFQAKALISSKDLNKVINDKYTWNYHKGNGQPKVISNSAKGKLYLDTFLMKPSNNMRVHHINLNPLDNRRCNLENKEK